MGAPVGNWLTAEQGKRLLLTADGTSLRGKRDYAALAILLGCGLRRAELTALRIEDLQQREEHWVIADLVGKGGHSRSNSGVLSGPCRAIWVFARNSRGAKWWPKSVGPGEDRR